MLNFGNKEFRNLQEQVLYNANAIEQLKQGLKIVGVGTVIPDELEVGEAYLVGSGVPYTLYLKLEDEILNLGQFPVPGPQGNPGPAGDKAVIGNISTATTTLESGMAASVSATTNGTDVAFNFEIPQGAIGPAGPRGEKGEKGEIGPQGEQGIQGETAYGVKILGTLTNSSLLPTPTTVERNAGYLVGASSPYDLYLIIGTTTLTWFDVGSFSPNSVVVDSAFSLSSTNTIQNKLVSEQLCSQLTATVSQPGIYLGEYSSSDTKSVHDPNYYACTPGRNIYWSYTGDTYELLRVAFYTSDKTYISETGYLLANNSAPQVVPATAAFCRFSYRHCNSAGVIDTTPYDEEEANAIKRYVIGIDLKQADMEAAIAQNASDIEDLEEDIATVAPVKNMVYRPRLQSELNNMLDDQEDAEGNAGALHEGYRLNSSGNLTALSGYTTSDFIPWSKSDGTIYFTYPNGETLGNGQYIYFSLFNSSKAHIQGLRPQQYQSSSTVVSEGNDIYYQYSKDQAVFLKWRAPTQTNSSVIYYSFCLDEGSTQYANTAYIRISMPTADIKNNLIMSLEDPNGFVGETMDTGHTPVRGQMIESLVPNNGKLDVKYSSLKSQIDKNTAAIAAIAGTGTTVVDKYKTQIDKAIQFGYQSVRDQWGIPANKLFQFIHISDTHGSANVSNIPVIADYLYNNGYCNLVLHTGDIHSSTFADSAACTAWLNATADMSCPALWVSGNHDVGNNSKNISDGTTATDAQLYTRMFAPMFSRYTVSSHPTDKNYWYTDFADQKVRVIGLYNFESDWILNAAGTELADGRGNAAYKQAQLEWLVDALEDCPAGYGVIIAGHNPQNYRGTTATGFNSRPLQGRNTAQTFVSVNLIPTIVQAFIDHTTLSLPITETRGVNASFTLTGDFTSLNTGAHFICYCSGHTHADGVSFLKDYPAQLELNVGCDNFHYQHYSDQINQNNTLHQDCINYVSVDVGTKMLYIKRIGNDFTAVGPREFTAIKYRPEA